LNAVDDRERFVVKLPCNPVHGPFVLHLQTVKESEVAVNMPLGVGLPVSDDRLHVHWTLTYQDPIVAYRRQEAAISGQAALSGSSSRLHKSRNHSKKSS
jgi:hypothetical protein